SKEIVCHYARTGTLRSLCCLLRDQLYTDSTSQSIKFRQDRPVATSRLEQKLPCRTDPLRNKPSQRLGGVVPPTELIEGRLRFSREHRRHAAIMPSQTLTDENGSL